MNRMYRLTCTIKRSALLNHVIFALRPVGDQAWIYVNPYVPYQCETRLNFSSRYSYMCDIMPLKENAVIELYIKKVESFQLDDWQCRGENSLFSNWINLRRHGE